MANINQIQVGSTTYDIEDQTARSDIASLATVATSGDYTDLSNKPSKLSDLTDDLGSSPTHTHSQYMLYIKNISVASSDWVAGIFTSASGVKYTYYKDVSVTGMTENDFVDISNMGSTSSYTENYAVQSMAGKFRLRVTTQPSNSTTWHVYYTIGKTAS